MPALSESQQDTDFSRGTIREVTPLSLWGGDTLVYRSIIALAIVALPLVGLANWLAHGAPWGPQITLAAAILAGALACYALSRRGMRDSAAALLIGVIWLAATIFALDTGLGIHSSVIYLYLPCLLYGVLFFGVTFASIELVLTIAALLVMYWAEERGAIGGLRAFTELSSNLNFLIGIIATCIGTLVVGVVYHRRVASEAARVVAGAEQLRLAMERGHVGQAELQTAHAQLQELHAKLGEQGKFRDLEMARMKRDIDLFHDVVSKDFPASLRSLRDAVAAPNEQTEARLQREIGHMETVVGALEELGRQGQPALERTPVSLSALAQEERDHLRSGREFARARFDIDAGLHAEGDRRALAALLRHLVKRAARACQSEREPLVHVGGGSHQGHAVFFVRDNGPGDTVDIGIVSARRIVERHGGELFIDSAPGAGTTIFFSLPTGGK